jgi:hypothetical protein
MQPTKKEQQLHIFTFIPRKIKMVQQSLGVGQGRLVVWLTNWFE